MAEKLAVEYEVSVVGIEAASAAADATLPKMLLTLRTVNSARSAIQQTSRAITDLNINAAIYGFLSMVQVVRNLNSLMQILKKSTASAGAAQAILAALTGNWWMIPLALTAGAIMYSYISSLATGGPIDKTGLYLLHRGEYVIPANQVNSFGPIFVNIVRPSNDNADYRDLVRGMGTAFATQARRGG